MFTFRLGFRYHVLDLPTGFGRGSPHAGSKFVTGRNDSLHERA
jgi:hypothetical protein